MPYLIYLLFGPINWIGYKGKWWKNTRNMPITHPGIHAVQLFTAIAGALAVFGIWYYTGYRNPEVNYLGAQLRLFGEGWFVSILLWLITEFRPSYPIDEIVHTLSAVFFAVTFGSLAGAAASILL